MLRLSDLRNDRPLSLDLGLDGSPWDNTTLGRLGIDTDYSVYLTEIPMAYRQATHVWRVVHAFWSPEDAPLTRFWAYDIEGRPIRGDFGVHYHPFDKDRVTRGSYKYPPPFGADYLWTVDNQFVTVNAGGYTVQVLDEDYPSEAMNFGLGTKGRHQGLVIGFRLFLMTPGYPAE